MDLGLRQSDVAHRIGVWTSTINYWENNRFNPEVQYVPLIVAFLGYDPFGPTPTSFPLQLKAARIAAGLTRRRLAARLGVHPGTVAEWERDEAEPSEANREQLDQLMGCSGIPAASLLVASVNRHPPLAPDALPSPLRWSSVRRLGGLVRRR